MPPTRNVKSAEIVQSTPAKLTNSTLERKTFPHTPAVMYFLYSFLTLVVFVLVSPYFLYQAIRHNKYIGSLGQRLGYLPVSLNVDGEESIWIHAVSVGEALTARALAADLKERYPRLRLYLSTTTIAGQHVARRSLQHVDAVFYFPFDWAFIVKRTLNIVRPRVFVMMETEIWPNLLRLCRARGVKTILINGRISSRSYPRYRLIRPFFRRVLADVDRFCMQSDESARRIVELGADQSKVTVTGSLKFDSLEMPAVVSHGKPRERVLRFFRLSPNRMVLVAGSTVRGEEPAVLKAFSRLKGASPSALAILAPRQPERFGEVERLAREVGIRHRAPFRSADRHRAAGGCRRARYDRRAGAAVSGGDRRVRRRQPRRSRRPQHPRAGGLRQADPVRSAHAELQGDRRRVRRPTARRCRSAPSASWSRRWSAWSTDPVRRAKLGAAARALVEANRGAKDKTLAVIAELLAVRQRCRPSVPVGTLADLKVRTTRV